VDILNIICYNTAKRIREREFIDASEILNKEIEINDNFEEPE
jgi:hypothetical protein